VAAVSEEPRDLLGGDRRKSRPIASIKASRVLARVTCSHSDVQRGSSKTYVVATLSESY
jgi:hypothetical protein